MTSPESNQTEQPRVDRLASRVAALEAQDAWLASLERRVTELERRFGMTQRGVQRIEL